MSDERPIPASERRLARARERGTVPVRRVPVALCGVLGAALGFAAAGMPSALVQLVSDGLRHAATRGAPLRGASELSVLAWSVLELSWPVFAGGLVGVVAGTVAQSGGVLTWTRPRASVSARVASMSGPGAWGRAIAGLIWVGAAGGAAALVVRSQWHLIAALPQAPLLDGVNAAARVLLGAALAAFAALAAIAVIDGVWSRWRWRQQMAMSPHEAREEQLAADGRSRFTGFRRRAKVATR